jgi:hypothetical protein
MTMSEIASGKAAISLSSVPNKGSVLANSPIPRVPAMGIVQVGQPKVANARSTVQPTLDSESGRSNLNGAKNSYIQLGNRKPLLLCDGTSA